MNRFGSAVSFSIKSSGLPLFFFTALKSPSLAPKAVEFRHRSKKRPGRRSEAPLSVLVVLVVLFDRQIKRPRDDLANRLLDLGLALHISEEGDDRVSNLRRPPCVARRCCMVHRRAIRANEQLTDAFVVGVF